MRLRGGSSCSFPVDCPFAFIVGEGRVTILSMFTVFIIGNIASGKSAASRYLESAGGLRIDLDELAKSLYVPGSDVVHDIAATFGWDVLDAQGGIRRDVLAQRAFDTPDSSERLNRIVYPALLQQLSYRLIPSECCSVMVPKHPFAVVEISVAQSFQEAFDLADEVIAITAPLEIRRLRAIERGMTGDDFDARSACQPSEEELCALATTVIDNSDGSYALFAALDAWLSRHGFSQGGDVSHG